MMKILTLIVILCCTYLAVVAQNPIDKKLYLIITTDSLKSSPALKSFVSFRNADFTVEVKTTDSLGKTSNEYRDFIRTKKPAYVLLVGKYGDFPTYYINYEAYVETYNYYVASTLTGHPNPDIALGLFFVSNETELQNIVNKTIYTENHIDNMPKKVYLHAGSTEPLWPWPLEFNEELLTEMYTNYFAPDDYTYTMSTANDATPNDAITDAQTINSGIKYFFYHGHGLIAKWSFGMGVPGIKQLNNSVYPFIFSFSCLTGSFSNQIDTNKAECFAKNIVASAKGACAFLGAYNTSGRGMNALLNGLCSSMSNDSIYRLGDALLRAYNNTLLPNTVLKYHPTLNEEERTRTAWQFHLFGDPALKFKNAPATVNIKKINNNEFSIYPNPTSNIMTLDFNSSQTIKHIEIINTLGQIVFSQQFNTSTSQHHSIDINQLNPGLYFIMLGTNVKKFVKQ